MTNKDRERFKRHLSLEDVGEEGQKKIFKAKVLIIGAGGLGAPNAFYLSAAGVGNIGLCDFDRVELSNLQRQILHNEYDINNFKIDSAYNKLHALNTNNKINLIYEKINKNNILDIIKDYDFIIDACDNFATKFLINDACVKLNKPFNYAGVYKFSGQTMSVIPHKSACLSCVFGVPHIKLSPAFKAGLFGVNPGLIGCIQASEALKYIIFGDNSAEAPLLLNYLLHVDIKTMDFKKISVNKNPHCHICSLATNDLILKDYEANS